MQKRCNNCFKVYDDIFEICPKCGYAEGDDAKELFHLKPGLMLADRYIVGREIGTGGFGITYLAWDTKLEIIVAIKEYYPSGIVNRIPGTKEVVLFAKKKRKQFEFGFARFIEEAKYNAKFVSHPNIVNVYEYFEENNTAYIVMEYLDGISLESRLEGQNGVFSVEDTISLVTEVLHALRDIHKKGIIHRDIAPDNIMILKDGKIKVFDFGAARFSLDKDRQIAVVVKPGFAPAEQYEKVSTQGPWTDIYALGAMMYMMLSGVKPEESTKRKNVDSVIPLHELNPDVPVYLSNVVMKAMAMNAALRFQSAKDMEKALLQQKKVYAPEDDQKRRKNRRLLTITGCGLVACLATVVLGVRFWNLYIPAVSISVCYQKTEIGALDTAKEEAMLAVAEQFQELYPQVDVEISGKTTVELEEMLEQNTLDTPVLFESTGLSDSISEKCVNLSSVLDANTLSECYFADEILTYAASQKKIPLGFSMPVFFVNRSLCEVEFPEKDARLVSVGNQSVQLAGEGKSYPVSNAFVYTMDRDVYARLFPEMTLTETDDVTAFLNRQTAYYFSDSSDYLSIISSIPGQSVVIPVDAEATTEGVPCQFSFTWSAFAGNSAAKKAMKQMILYMLSEEGQETLMVQNQSSIMPLHQTALEHYCSVYQEIFSSVPEEIADGDLYMEE